VADAPHVDPTEARLPSLHRRRRLRREDVALGVPDQEDGAPERFQACPSRQAGGAGRFRCRPRRLPDGRIELEAPLAVRRPPDRPSDRDGQRRGRKLLQPGILAEGPLGGGGQIREPLGDAGRVHRHARRTARINAGPDVVEDERAEPLGRRGREGESDETAQRGAEDVDGVEPERVQEREHVRHVLRDQVGSRRPLALPPTAEIECQAAMAPAQPRRDRIERVALLREPVQTRRSADCGPRCRPGRMS
jgi:hypothetical protein